MSQYILANNILFSDPLQGSVLMRAGKTVDTAVYSLTTLRAASAILYPVNSATSARALRLVHDYRDRGDGGPQLDKGDQVGPYTSPPSSPVTFASVTHATSPYQAQPTDVYVEADVTGGTVTVDLQTAPVSLQEITIKNSAGDASVNPITVVAAGSAQVEDPNNPGTLASSVTIRVAGASVLWTFDGTNWRL